MDVVSGPRLLLLLCALVVAAGCATVKKADPGAVCDMVPPTQRIEDLRELAKTAATKNATEKQMISQQLAADIKHEADPLIRAQIVRTLGDYPGTASDTVLRAAVRDPDNDVRLAACESWGKRDTAEAATVLAGVLNGDVDHDVRLAAARNMAPLHQRAAITALAGALEDKDPAMQYRAVVSLRQVTGQDLGNDVNKWREYARNNQLHPAQPEVSLAERIWHPF
jgi:HEAT repeat protein